VPALYDLARGQWIPATERDDASQPWEAEGTDVQIEELKKAKDQRPFQPFLIRMEDGREIQVRNPDAVAWDFDRPRIAVCAMPGGGWEVIDVAQVTSLGVPRLAPAEESAVEGYRS
jgi:hypothetical protein